MPDSTDFLMVLSIALVILFFSFTAFLIGRARGYDEAEHHYVATIANLQDSFHAYLNKLSNELNDPADWWKNAKN